MRKGSDKYLGDGKGPGILAGDTVVEWVICSPLNSVIKRFK